MSDLLLQALVRDLAARRPGTRFGRGQESASEGLTLLLDMLEPPGAAVATDGYFAAAFASPVPRLFLHRSRAETVCAACRRAGEARHEYSSVLELFHLDALPRPPHDVKSFSDAVVCCATPVAGYACPHCGPGRAGLRVYTITMLPEVLVCAFNVYGERRPRYIAPRLHIPTAAGQRLVYEAVAQIEHFGSLGGGHYVARAVRSAAPAGPVGWWLCNDTGVSPTAFAPTPDTYLVFYHYARTEDAAAGAEEPLAPPAEPPAAPPAPLAAAATTAALPPAAQAPADAQKAPQAPRRWVVC